MQRPVQRRSAGDLQDVLGVLNDRAVALSLLDAAMAAARPASTHDWLGGALAVWLSVEAERREAKLDMAWRRFRIARRFWRTTAVAA